MKSILKFIILTLIIAIIITICFIFYNNINNSRISLILYGDKEINIYEGETYKEAGFIAKDKNNNFINNQVTIKSDLNSNIVGKYTITYSIKTKFKSITKKRIVNVLKDPLKNIDFTLNGNEIINISLGEEYNDPLFNCIDRLNNNDLSSLVEIKNKPNNQSIGTYEVQYILKIDNKEKILTRTVNVLKSKYDYKISNTEYTNQDINILFVSNIPNFSYIITPNNDKVFENSTSLSISTNGEYKFIVYDKQDNYEEYTIPITNIDKEKPIITSCNSIINNNQTTFTITPQSDDITKYIINNNTFNATSYTINQIIENGIVTIYDKANNTNTFTCNSSYKEITPKGNENIIANSNTSTLKVWIEKINRSGRTSYYTTHIWAKDPYNQLKTQVPNNFGGELVYANQLLNNAISQNNWQNKLILAVNASGFVKNGVWSTDHYNANHAWNLTSVSPIVITNGRVLRNFTSGTIPNPYITYGLKKDGNLAYYTFTKGTSLQSNINVSNQIINDGVLNTFAFTPVLVFNSKKVSTATDKNIRQGFCQIDKNNFVFITDIYNSARNGFNFNELADYMLKLGCKTGFNLDGGGSTSLIFKDKNNSPNTITGNTRQIADILYFHE